MPNTAQLHHEFFRQCENMPQKIALILDEQMLTFAELMHYVQTVAVHLIKKEPQIHTDEIVYQMLQRSIELPIAYFGILTAGGVYCALNPTDLPSITDKIIDQTGKAKCVLVQESTDREMAATRIRIDKILTADTRLSDDDLTMLSEIVGKRAFITCTSGTTGKSKVIVHTHESALWNPRSVRIAGLISHTDTVIAWASTSFIINLIDMACAWLNGATLLLLKEGGNMNVDYLTQVIARYQATYLLTSPVVLPMLANLFRQQPCTAHRLDSLRILSTAGESLKISTFRDIIPYLSTKTSFINLFGQSECHSICSYKMDDLEHVSFDSFVVPIGRTLPECKVVLIDEHEQIISSADTIGELFVGGPGIFQEYMNDPELTAEKFNYIDGVRYVRTGDLQKWDKDFNLVQVGRIDYQIKLRGQRIEPAEIENVIMNASSLIHECLVMTVEHDGQDYLVAYLAATVSQEEKADEKLITTIEETCCSLLPPIKRASVYHILQENKFPRNQNGKIIRNLLPQPVFPKSESLIETKPLDKDSSLTEHHIQQLWQQVLSSRGKQQQKDLPVDKNWYQLGGASLDIMKLLSEYQHNFVHNECGLPMAQLIQQATIREHIDILNEALEIYRKDNNEQATCSGQLQRTEVTQGPINPIWIPPLDARNTASFQSKAGGDGLNVVLAFILRGSSVSIQRLRRALHFAIKKHETLHTSIIRDPISNQWIQRIQQLDGEGFSFLRDRLTDYNNNVEDLVKKEYSFDIHDVPHGQLVRLHIVHKSNENQGNDDEIIPGDMIIINMRHEGIDGTSTPIFFDTLAQAYSNEKESFINPNAIRYLDYMLHLEQTDLSASFAYWDKQMESFNFARHFNRIPVDRPYVLGDAAFGPPRIISFSVDQCILEAMINCAAMNNVTLATICASCHVAFLFELTNDWDVVFEATVANRPQEPEAVDIVGNFFYLPIVRVNLENNPETTFVTLLRRVQSLINSALLHARAQWSPFGNNTLEPSADGTSFNYPLTGFQFEQYQKSFVLDTSSEHGSVLEYVHNERDSLLAGLWARAEGRLALFMEAFYMLPDMRLTFGMYFAPSCYDHSTAERLSNQFRALIRRIFTDGSFADRMEKPLNYWLQNTTSNDS